MPHWRVKYTRRGFEPPRPFGRTSTVVCAADRAEAKRCVEAAVGYPCTASAVDAPVSFGQVCVCPASQIRESGK